jgi:hypothetical protein
MIESVLLNDCHDFEVSDEDLLRRRIFDHFEKISMFKDATEVISTQFFFFWKMKH